MGSHIPIKYQVKLVLPYHMMFNRNDMQQKEHTIMQTYDNVKHAIMLNCIIVWGHFCWKCARVKSYIYIHAQCVNWSAGISYQHSRACPLIGSFLVGFTYLDGRERESCSSTDYFFLRFHIVTTGNVFLCLTMIQKKKNIKTLGNLINTRRLRRLEQIR
jgi:hypothetical protein